MRWVQGIGLIAVCFGIPIALVLGLRAIPDAGVKPSSVSYAELVSILLTGVTVILAVFALLVGGLAIWGYQGLKSAATTMVKAEVDAAIRIQLSSEAVQSRMRTALEAGISDMMYPEAFADNPSPIPADIGEPPMGEQYPDTPGKGDAS